MFDQYTKVVTDRALDELRRSMRNVALVNEAQIRMREQQKEFDEEHERLKERINGLHRSVQNITR